MSEKTFKIVGDDISDGFHTFDELYEHRIALFLAWMNSDGCPGDVYVVDDHYEGWDLIVCETPHGQISYHVPVSYRPYYSDFQRVVEAAHHWDGHTPKDVVNRILRWIAA